MKTVVRVPVCLLAALQALMLQAVAQQFKGGLSESVSCGSNNRSIFEASVQPADAGAAASASASLPLFGDFSFSTSSANALGRKLHDLFPDGLRLEYSGARLVHAESVGAFGSVSIQLRYVDGYQDFDTDPMKNTPQDDEMRRRAARRVLLFGGNTFFYSAKEGTGLFLGAKKRSCLLFGASGNGLHARLAFAF